MEAIIDAKKQISFRACVLGVGGDEIINGFTNLMYAKKALHHFLRCSSYSSNGD
jgi:hypothetical protein